MLGATAQPPLSDVLRVTSTTPDPKGALRLKLVRAMRGKAGKKRKIVCRDVDENDGVHRVRAAIEARDEPATYLESGFSWLKWGDLSAYAPVDREQPGVWGKIVDFDWQARLSPLVYRSRQASPATFRPPNAAAGD